MRAVWGLLAFFAAFGLFEVWGDGDGDGAVFEGGGEDGEGFFGGAAAGFAFEVKGGVVAGALEFLVGLGPLDLAALVGALGGDC